MTSNCSLRFNWLLEVSCICAPEFLSSLSKCLVSRSRVLRSSSLFWFEFSSMSPRFVQQRLQFPDDALNLFAQLLDERLPDDREAKLSTVKI